MRSRRSTRPEIRNGLLSTCWYLPAHVARPDVDAPLERHLIPIGERRRPPLSLGERPPAAEEGCPAETVRELLGDPVRAVLPESFVVPLAGSPVAVADADQLDPCAEQDRTVPPGEPLDHPLVPWIEVVAIALEEDAGVQVGLARESSNVRPARGLKQHHGSSGSRALPSPARRLDRRQPATTPPARIHTGSHARWSLAPSRRRPTRAAAQRTTGRLRGPPPRTRRRRP